MRPSCSRFLLITLMLLLSGLQPAGATGSIFSGLGYGVIEGFTSSRATALGGAGLALNDSLCINFQNPALLAGLLKTRASVGGYLSRQWMRDHQSQDVDDWAQVEYFGLGVPVGKGLVLGFTLAPYSRVEFRYGWNGSLEGVPYYESYQGNGGLSRAAFQMAWAPGPWGKLGAALHSTWGEVEQLRGSYFDASGYQDVEFFKSNQWRSFGGTLGIVLQPHPQFSVGAIYEPEVAIHVDQSYSYTNEDSTLAAQGEYRLAAHYGLGFAYGFSSQWLTSAQADYGAWGALHNLPGGANAYRDSYSLALGAEWTPGSWNADRFLRRLQYRGGLRLESDYVLCAGNPVRGYFLTLGSGYLFHAGKDRVDFALEIGQRGDLSKNDGQESILRLRVGLNLGEAWFQRPKPTWME